MSTFDSKCVARWPCTTQIKPEVASQAFDRSNPVASRQHSTHSAGSANLCRPGSWPLIRSSSPIIRSSTLAIEGSPVIGMWNLVRLQSNATSPAAEAFRHFMIEHGEAYMLAHDSPLLDSAESAMEETAP